MLKKYNIFYDLENNMFGIGLKNEDFQRTYPEPISPIDPVKPSSSSHPLVWIFLVLIFGGFTAFAYKK